MFESLILQSMLGVLLVAAAVPIIHSSLQPGGWLSRIGDWFSGDSARQRADAAPQPDRSVAQAPEPTPQQQAQITPTRTPPVPSAPVGRQF